MDALYKKEFLGALLSADRARAKQIVRETVMNGAVNSAVIEDIVVPALSDIGGLCDRGMVALSQIYISGMIGEEIIDSLLPKTNKKDKLGRIIIGTLGDFHTLGKKIVSSYLKASGFELIDIGSGVQPETFFEKANELKADIIAVSVLMLHAALRVQGIKDRVEATGNRKMKILVGGAPFNLDAGLFKKVGADATARNAPNAVIAAKELMVG